MKKVILVAMLVASVAIAQGLLLGGTPSLALTDCQPNGGDGGAVGAGGLKQGNYVVVVTGADTTLCQHPYFVANDGGYVCPSSGIRLPQGLVARWSVPSGGRGYSCRSDAGTGRVEFIPSGN